MFPRLYVLTALFTGWKQRRQQRQCHNKAFKLVFVYSRQGLSVTRDPSASLGAEISGMGYNTPSLYLCIF